MPRLEVICPHCSRVTSVDSTKVPDHPVAFKCPSCQGKVVVDKKKMLAGPDAAAAPAAGAGDGGETAAAGTAGAAPAAFDAPPEPIEQLSLPPGETLPPGLLVAEEAAVGERLRRALEPFECVLEVVATAEEARSRSLLDPPQLIVYVAGPVERPPYEPIGPLVGLPPRERRRTFVVLAAPNVKTLDGDLAFLFGVDLLLSHQHVAQAPAVLHAALRHHQRLYRAFFDALES